MLTGRSVSSALMPLSDAFALLTAGLDGVAPRTVMASAATGAVLAADVRAVADRPPRLVAARDGWAVALEAVAGASPYAPVLLGAPAVWLDSGDALPAGCDTVLAPEAIDAAFPTEVAADAAPGDGTIRPGGDLCAGDVVVAAGERVSALDGIGLVLAGIGAIDVRVPRIRLVSTGDGPGFEDALGPALAALVSAAGGEAEVIHVPDEVEAIAGAILAGQADAVLTIGGTGFGTTDRTAAALARAGVLLAHGIGLHPGGTAGFGTAGDRPVLLLPGRPEACLAAFLALGRPLFRVLAGAIERTAAPAPLLRKVSSALGVSEIVFVRRTPAGLEPLGGAEIPLRRLLQADGAILVPPESEGYPEGSPVEMIPL